jgi:hypothetical protein
VTIGFPGTGQALEETVLWLQRHLERDGHTSTLSTLYLRVQTDLTPATSPRLASVSVLNPAARAQCSPKYGQTVQTAVGQAVALGGAGSQQRPEPPCVFQTSIRKLGPSMCATPGLCVQHADLQGKTGCPPLPKSPTAHCSPRKW